MTKRAAAADLPSRVAGAAAPQRALIALGSNLGDRHGTLSSAVEALQRLAVGPLTCSRWHETAPMYVTDQPAFVNGVVAGRFPLAPEALLDALLEIERAHGRVRSERYGPRTLDLDVIAYGSLVLRTARLTLPHPRLHERGFVVHPAAEVAPDWVHPLLGKTMRALSDALASEG